MKKLAAISLAVLILFNTTGYRLFILYEQHKADNSFVSRLDKGNYTNKDLVTIKVPLHLPYLSNNNEFERVNGEITFNGQVYKYVQRKITNDTMILLCLQHAEKTQLEEQAYDYFGKMNDLPGSDKTHSANALKQLLNEYDDNSVQYFLSVAVSSFDFNLYKNTSDLYHYISFRGKPPKCFM